ncbi:MAG: DUF4037 domain-containing protein [Clostridia bacterium]|nr:DUF4037 domain-containing protein [Clostridia bacterium]
MNGQDGSIRGLELSRRYYETFGKPMLDSFPEASGFLAVGLTGSGSECYGFDDELSRDHDFEPGFCIFLPGEDVVDRRTEFLLERAYAKLPKTFCGFSRQPLSPVGGNRHGVLRIGTYFLEKIGSPDGNLDWTDWLRTPSFRFAEAVNGEVFSDPYGELSEIRARIARYPEDVRRKKLAGNLLMMSQSGEYNYFRCLGHGEKTAAQFALHEYVSAAVRSAFLIADAYCPYYKWAFRAMRELPGFRDLEPVLFEILSGGANGCDDASVRSLMDRVNRILTDRLAESGLTEGSETDLGKLAYGINDGIRDPMIRTLSILAACE